VNVTGESLAKVRGFPAKVGRRPYTLHGCTSSLFSGDSWEQSVKVPT